MNPNDNQSVASPNPSRDESTGWKRFFDFRSMLHAVRRFLTQTGMGTMLIISSLLVALLVCIGVFLLFAGVSRRGVAEVFEVGKVIDRDIVATQTIVYIDEAATALRLETERRQVPAVFILDETRTQNYLSQFERFQERSLALREQYGLDAQLAAELERQFGGLVPETVLTRLAEHPSLASVLSHASKVLAKILEQGIVAMPEQALEPYNPQFIELRRWQDGALEYERLDLDSIMTRFQLEGGLSQITRRLGLSGAMGGLVTELVTCFAQENVFYDENLSLKRLEAVSAAVEPVMRRLEQGEKIVRKGFVLTEQDLVRLEAMQQGSASISVAYLAGGALFIMVLFALALFFFSKRVIGVQLKDKRFLLVVVLAVLYYVLAAVMSALLPISMQPSLSAFLPGALFAMLLSILINERTAILFTVLLCLATLPLSGFDPVLLMQTFAVGCTGAFLVRRTEKRIDLVKAGAQLALLQFLTAVIITSMAGYSWQDSLGSAVWQALNAFFCGTLTLGFLPLLEHALNASTIFRLQELSDLNAPALKLLMSVAPGTYSHSIMVAHLAESACREIGAYALLARVGAYYHDIGKIEQPEYFIENQSGYNKHDDINPRLSATVLRSHVKFGIERAKSLGLPEEVLNIISEHHGTSIISYFFAQAQKEDTETSSDDYRYPGPLPGSRESAVVMLADCVEAASRTLKKPTMAKLEQFVKDMIGSKTESGQLARSSLTFHDLEQIKNIFVRILAGHFHSRIEYPRVKEVAK